jgi:hypothetical protein
MVEKIFRIFGKIAKKKINIMALSTMKKMELEMPKKAQDTTKMYNRGEFIQRINDITAGKVKLQKSDAKGTKTYKVKDKNGNEIEMSKDEFESFVKRRGGKIN